MLQNENLKNLDKKKSVQLGGFSDLEIMNIEQYVHCSNLDYNIDLEVCKSDIMTDLEVCNFDIMAEALKYFKPKKEQSNFLSAIYEHLGLYRQADRVLDCGSLLEFGIYQDVISKETEKKLMFGNFCKNRLCPMCNWRRSMKLFTQVNICMNALAKDNFDFLFLTLTIKNCKGSQLRHNLDILLKGYFKLFHDNRRIKKVVKGSYRAFEVTYNKLTDTYHPHLHCVLAVNKSYFKKDYIKQSEWAELWQNCINSDYLPVIDIRSVKSKKGENWENISFVDVCEELSKYVVKGSDFLNEKDFEGSCLRVSDLLSALTSRRLVGFTGVFSKVRKQFNLDDPESGNLTDLGLNVPRGDLVKVVRLGFVNGEYVVLKNE